MAKQAILLYAGTITREQVLLARVLEFFGVPWKTAELSNFLDSGVNSGDCIVFGSVPTVAAAVQRIDGANNESRHHAAFYVYPGSDRSAANRGLRFLCGQSSISLRDAPEGIVALRVSRDPEAMTGPMGGLEVRLQMKKEDAVVEGIETDETEIATIISVAGAPIFMRLRDGDVPIFLCTSSYAIDIDEEVGASFYDVKNHFCSAVPLVMFIRQMFKEVAWQPQELGACLIIDDPLLRKRYGRCDFRILRGLMQQYGFTTNIAFIPWNWRRTSSAAREFFGNGSGLFSVSIHGCDHIKSEFGDSSPAVLDSRIRLAGFRMRRHEARTGIHHDPVMVFPQGVFSSPCPRILKHNGLLAAVNTEIDPVDPSTAGTRIRDVWDVAIMKYGDFAIFTRRYSHHGIENFAFDLLLGKPCLIVTHHEFFKDRCAGLIELIHNLQALNCSLQWRPLAGVIRGACRKRITGLGAEEVEMYSSELLIRNAKDHAVRVKVLKREADAEAVTEVTCDLKPIEWTTEGHNCSFGETIEAHSSRHFQVSYREQCQKETVVRSFKFESMVAARRILSEFRDTYL